MGSQIGGVMNAKGLSQSLMSNTKFAKEAVNLQGILNDFLYPIKRQEKEKVLSSELEYAVVTNPFTLKKEYYVSTFLKSKYDGIGKRSPIDIVIVLDISGSMGSSMATRIQGKNSTSSVLDIAKVAITKLIGVLNPEDQISLVIFDTSAETVFPLTKPDQFVNLQDVLAPIIPRGGTNLNAGLEQGVKEMRAKLTKGSSHRIFYMTDMCHNCGDLDFIKLFSSITLEEEPIYTSIIGLGGQLDSSYLNLCSNNIGTSSFSAVTEEDLEEIIVRDFQCNFFPIAKDINVRFKSGNFYVEKYYGASSNELSVEKQKEWKTATHSKMGNQLKTSVNFLMLLFNRMKKRLPKSVLKTFCDFNVYTNESLLDVKSLLPSFLTSIEGNDSIFMKGGLLLLKVKPEKIQYDSLVEVTLTGTDLDGPVFTDKQTARFSHLNSEEDYFSSESIKAGITLVYYAKYLKNFTKVVTYYERNPIKDEKGVVSIIPPYEKEKEQYEFSIQFTDNIKKLIENNIMDAKKKEEMLQIIDHSYNIFKPNLPIEKTATETIDSTQVTQPTPA